ncbi:hypothetical protein BJ138DRAFT_1074983 [Hygrophoropsis aurantiaca]|uniref:Uncharacterized protein n=1 Tax=Hygrophoropsis aurantiaca TaxID=72124 RepID=A0ACB8AUV0_9AGAM|nr:hypothetical protein BJ138DRAFT_1074983 [Hygrophoropsis aurantiaca]
MSTSATLDSRSSSPTTPETSDHQQRVAIHHDNELSSWYNTICPGKILSVSGSWNSDPLEHSSGKAEDTSMLQLGDLIEEHAYESGGSEMDCSTTYSRPTNSLKPESLAQLNGPQQPSHPETEYVVPSPSQFCSTSVVPPPATRPRTRDPATAPHRVVHPPKESCVNLPILTPSIPETGTKSRVETQVRVTVDLAHASSSSGEPYQYDRVGSWKWLKLPPGTATKKRTRKEGKIDPAPLDTLHLFATVSCATPPHNRVLSCGSCRNREAKRVVRKLAARVRPARSDSDGPDDGSERPRGSKEDTNSIIQFNCPEVLDFSSGSVVLPVRITCYCRHHREKVGFHVHFSMLDHTGRIVGTGTTPPIMITDDHKSTTKPPPVFNPIAESPVDWPQVAQFTEPPEKRAPSKRKPASTKGQPKKRAKPYDSMSRGTSAKFSREGSIASFTSPATSPAALPSTSPNTRSPTPSHVPHSLSSLSFTPFTDDPSVPPAYNVASPQEQETDSVAAALALTAQLDAAIAGADSEMLDPTDSIFPINTPEQFMSPIDSSVPSPVVVPSSQVSSPSSSVMPPQSLPFLFFNSGAPPSLPLPKIHRLIPSSGPTHGGIEVTVLGENFLPMLELNCVFGGVIASSTQRWSDNTLVCVLPPRASPGVVAVWFDGIEKTNDPSLPSLFTYRDESDRALMELALQVVGLKMTGQIEGARDVALRIVGTTGTEESTNTGPTEMTQTASNSTSFRDIRPLLLVSSSEGEGFESTIVKFLSILDVATHRQSDISMASAISHPTSSGQTLLHLAAFLGFDTLVEFLIDHDIDLDARDRNGCTALHFAVTARSKTCARLLVDAGADLEIVDALGKTPEDVAPNGFFEENIFGYVLGNRSRSVTDDEGESQWGDIETDDENDEITVKRRAFIRSARRRPDIRTQDSDSDAAQMKSTPIHIDTPLGDLDIKKPVDAPVPDDKQAASFVDLIQRTLAQLHAPQGIISNMPQLPLPHLPGMPAVSWTALPQIPVAFPVFVPMPGWPSFFADKREDSGSLDETRPTSNSAVRTAQEWRATWEKWMALAIATAMRQQPTEEAPPMYTPRETPEHLEATPNISRAQTLPPPDSDVMKALPRSLSDLDKSISQTQPEKPPSPLEVDSVINKPTKVRVQKIQQKHDRMLVLFWLPILLVSLIWAFHNGIRFALQALKTTLSLKTSVRA